MAIGCTVSTASSSSLPRRAYNADAHLSLKIIKLFPASKALASAGQRGKDNKDRHGEKIKK